GAPCTSTLTPSSSARRSRDSSASRATNSSASVRVSNKGRLLTRTGVMSLTVLTESFVIHRRVHRCVSLGDRPPGARPHSVSAARRLGGYSARRLLGGAHQ